MRRPRRWLPTTVLVVGLVGVAVGCSGQDTPTATRPFCRAADDLSAELERARAKGEASVARQLPLVEAVAREAPKQIAADAATYAEAMRKLDAGDRSVVDDPNVQTAVDNVNRFANQACNVYERDSGL